MESKYLMTMIAGKLGPRDLRIFSLVCKEWKKIGDEVIGIEEKLRIKRVNQRKDAARYVQFLCCASFWGLYLASVLCSVHFLVPQFVAAIILVLCFLSILTPFHYKKYCTDVVFFHFFTWLYSTAPLVHVITSEAIPYYQKVISCSLSTTLLFRCVFRAVMCRSHIRRKDFKRTMSHAQRSTMIILFSATYFSWTALFSVTYIISEVLLSLWVTIIYKNTLEHWRWLLWPVSTPFRHIQRAQMEVVSGYCCMVLMAFSHAILKNQNNHVVIVSSALLLLFLHKSNSKNWMSPPMFEYLSYDNM
ncbi:hypothetical protein Pelo_7373 [Pelomyxa schiedti]|nr:hypothetical protein Pelo_7373 [Pelomyxa schiedti]